MDLERESKICNSCEVLKLENARLVRQNNELLHQLLNPPVVGEVKVEKDTELKPLHHTRFGSWRVKQQMLEENSRNEARLFQEKQKELNATRTGTVALDINQIEKELGVTDAI